MHQVTAYFDTNVYSHIRTCTGPVNRGTVAACRKAIEAGRLSVRLGFHNLEEIILGFEGDPVQARAGLQFASEVAEEGMVIKPSGELLLDQLRATAKGGLPADPYMSDPDVGKQLAEMLDPKTLEDVLDIYDTIQKTNQRIAGFVKMIEDMQLYWTARVGQRLKTERVVFPELWRRNSAETLEDLVLRTGLFSPTASPDIVALLELPTFRALTADWLSRMYAHLIEGRRPVPGDSRDNKHATTAAVTDFFVTHDKPFARIAGRDGISGMEIVELPELLARIGFPPPKQ